MTQAIDRIGADLRAAGPASASDARRSGQGPHVPVTAQIIALPELQGHHSDDASAPRTESSVVRDWNPLHQIKAQLQVCVGEATLTVGELLAAKEHQVLRLNRTVDELVELTIEGKVVARGQLVAVDGHFAVRLTDLPVALDLSPRS